MEEIWKDIPGYEGHYMVSNMGRVKSFNYRNTNREHILKPRKLKHYSRYGLGKGGENDKYAHVLVWETFKGNVPEGYEVHHKSKDLDGNKLFDNSLVNLELKSIHEHRKHHGREMAKPVICLDLNGKFVAEYESCRAAGKNLGNENGATAICACCKGKIPKYKGFVWKYK